MHDTVLSKALVGHEGLIRKLGLVMGGSILVALAAQVSVGWPVAITLQTLAVLIVGLTYGSTLGAATLITYIGYGALGFPVFAHGGAAASLVGPSAGFIYGFVVMAFLAGLAVEKGLARGVVSTAICGIVLSALLYIPGVAWAIAVFGKTAPELWAHWISPFLAGDAIKAVIAAMVVWGGWQALGLRKN